MNEHEPTDETTEPTLDPTANDAIRGAETSVETGVDASDAIGHADVGESTDLTEPMDTVAGSDDDAPADVHPVDHDTSADSADAADGSGAPRRRRRGVLTAVAAGVIGIAIGAGAAFGGAALFGHDQRDHGGYEEVDGMQDGHMRGGDTHGGHIDGDHMHGDQTGSDIGG